MWYDFSVAAYDFIDCYLKSNFRGNEHLQPDEMDACEAMAENSGASDVVHCILGMSAKSLKKDTAFYAVRRIRRN